MRAPTFGRILAPRRTPLNDCRSPRQRLDTLGPTRHDWGHPFVPLGTARPSRPTQGVRARSNRTSLRVVLGLLALGRPSPPPPPPPTRARGRQPAVDWTAGMKKGKPELKSGARWPSGRRASCSSATPRRAAIFAIDTGDRRRQAGRRGARASSRQGRGDRREDRRPAGHRRRSRC